MLLSASIQALGYLFLAIVAASMFFIPFVLLRQQKVRPVVISPDSARRHFRLVWLIRGTEFLVACLMFSVLALIGLGFLLEMNPFKPAPVLWRVFGFSMLILTLLVGALLLSWLIGRLPKSWREGIRAFWEVNANSVGSFAFIFAAFVSHDLYHFLPPSRLGAAQPPSFGADFLDRDFLWIIVFWLVWYSTKNLLLRLLEMNAPGHPQKPDDSDSSRPFVPFDPYNLAKNQPIRPLPEG